MSTRSEDWAGELKLVAGMAVTPGAAFVPQPARRNIRHMPALETATMLDFLFMVVSLLLFLIATSSSRHDSQLLSHRVRTYICLLWSCRNISSLLCDKRPHQCSPRPFHYQAYPGTPVISSRTPARALEPA